MAAYLIQRDEELEADLSVFHCFAVNVHNQQSRSHSHSVSICQLQLAAFHGPALGKG